MEGRDAVRVAGVHVCPGSEASGHRRGGRRLEERLGVPIVAAHRYRSTSCGGRTDRGRWDGGRNSGGRLGARWLRRRGRFRRRRRRCAGSPKKLGCGPVEIPGDRQSLSLLPAADRVTRARAEQAIRLARVEAFVPQPLLNQPPRRPVETQRLLSRRRVLSDHGRGGDEGPCRQRHRERPHRTFRDSPAGPPPAGLDADGRGHGRRQHDGQQQETLRRHAAPGRHPAEILPPGAELQGARSPWHGLLVRFEDKPSQCGRTTGNGIAERRLRRRGDSNAYTVRSADSSPRSEGFATGSSSYSFVVFRRRVPGGSPARAPAAYQPERADASSSGDDARALGHHGRSSAGGRCGRWLPAAEKRSSGSDRPARRRPPARARPTASPSRRAPGRERRSLIRTRMRWVCASMTGKHCRVSTASGGAGTPSAVGLEPLIEICGAEHRSQTG